jgi:hypothetical protein
MGKQKTPALTPAEKAILATLPIKYGVGRPSNRRKKLLATIAYALLRLEQQRKTAND